MRKNVPSLLRGAAVLGLCALSGWSGGCTAASTLATTRLNPAKPEGVPFTLPRPSFVVTEERGTPEKPYPVYTLGVEYIPDPEQRFTVKLDPALLSDADFKLTFGDLGQLTDLNAETRDQIVPTITAIGSFLVNAVGAVATAAGTAAILDQPARDPQFFLMLDQYFKNNKCEDKDCSDPKLRPGNCSSLKGAWEQMKQLPPVLVHATTPQEQEVLDIGLGLTQCHKDRYTNAFLQVEKDLAEALEAKTIDEDTAKKVKAILAKISEAEKPENLTGPRAETESLPATTIRDSLKALVTAAQQHLSLKEERAELELIEKQWRLRHALVLEMKINRLEREEMLAGTTEESQELRDLRLQWAITIGALDEYTRATELRKTLLAIARTEQHRERPIRESPPLADYQLAQKELGDLEAAIASKRNALVPKETSTTATPPAKRSVSPAVLWRNDQDRSTETWVKDCLDYLAQASSPAGKQPAAQPAAHLAPPPPPAGQQPAAQPAAHPGCAKSPWNNLASPGSSPEFVIVIEKGVQP